MNLATDRLVLEQVACRQELLAGHVLHEFLAAEARLHGHDHHDVEEGRVRLEGRQRGRRPQRKASGPARLADGPQRWHDRLLDLNVEGDRVAARIDEFVDVAARLRDHQVRVEGQARDAAERLDGSRAEGQVRHEVAVHDVEMDPVGAGLLASPDGGAQVREIGVEDARRDASSTRSHYSPTPAGTGSGLRSPRSALALSATIRSRRRATTGRAGSPACSAAS